MYTNQKEIIDRLILVYEEAIADMPDNLSDMKLCAEAHGVQLCIFNAMARNLADNSQQMLENYNLVCDLIDDYNDDGYPYWGIMPHMCLNQSDLIQSLEYRLFTLNIIKNELTTAGSTPHTNIS